MFTVEGRALAVELTAARVAEAGAAAVEEDDVEAAGTALVVVFMEEGISFLG